MAVVQVSIAPHREQYEKVRSLLPEAPPAGLITHAAAELPDGSVQIVDVYASQADLDTFAQTTLIPAFAQAGVMELVQSRPAPTAHEAFFVQTG